MQAAASSHEAEYSSAIADINITPFIDIMLVLLIIFMVAAPLMMGGVHVNLPKSSGSPMTKPENPLVVSIDASCRVFVDKEEVREEGREQFFQTLARGSETGEVYVRGDGEIKYAKMIELMGELGQAGFSRVTLVTQVGGDGASQSPEDASSALPTVNNGMAAASR